MELEDDDDELELADEADVLWLDFWVANSPKLKILPNLDSEVVGTDLAEVDIWMADEYAVSTEFSLDRAILKGVLVRFMISTDDDP